MVTQNLADDSSRPPDPAPLVQVGGGVRKRARPRGLVLLIDDFADAREMYAFDLARRGYRVAQAGEGHEALSVARALLPDLIVMDLSLPGIDGWQLTRILKTDPHTGGIAIVVLSAHTHPLERKRAFDAGCDAFLAKPCLPRALATRIRRQLSTRVSGA